MADTKPRRRRRGLSGLRNAFALCMVCPKCKATPGEPCRTEREVCAAHTARWQEAVKAVDAQQLLFEVYQEVDRLVEEWIDLYRAGAHRKPAS